MGQGPKKGQKLSRIISMAPYRRHSRISFWTFFSKELGGTLHFDIKIFYYYLFLTGLKQSIVKLLTFRNSLPQIKKIILLSDK
jgi:hypothetical protein